MTDRASTSTPDPRPPGRRRRLGVLTALAAAALLSLAGVALAGSSFIGMFTTVTSLSSTVPANGDQNPYGIVSVPRSVGRLVAGDLLISNFNNAATTANPGGLQGTGTTIDQINPKGPGFAAGKAPLFAKIDPAHLPGACPGGVGLTTALAALPTGYVIVGSLPTSDGTSATAGAGCLLVLGDDGRVVATIAGGLINGPWDMTSVTRGPITTLFVTSVLPGVSSTQADHATVVRIRLRTNPGMAPVVLNEDLVGTGFPARTDPAALVIGPTGVALSRDGTLYVADTLANRIAAIPDAMSRQHPIRNGGITVSTNGFLKGPLGLTLAPNGDILTANSLDGFIVETAPRGTQLTEKLADSTTGAGTLFGLTVPSGTNGVDFVDDGDNTLRLLH